MPKFELSFSWEQILISTRADDGRETVFGPGFGTERLLENVARALNASPMKAMEFVLLMPVWDDPALRALVFQPDLDVLENMAREAWVNFQTRNPRPAPELIVRDMDKRIPGLADYFDRTLRPLIPAPVILPPQVIEEQARRAEWYRSPWAVAGGVVGVSALGMIAAATWQVHNFSKIGDLQANRGTGTVSTSLPSAGQPGNGSRVSENPPVSVPRAPASPSVRLPNSPVAPPASPVQPGITASDPQAGETSAPIRPQGRTTGSNGAAPPPGVDTPRIPSDAPASLPPMAMVPPPGGESILPPPEFRAPRGSAAPGRPQRKQPKAPAPLKRSQVAAAVETQEAHRTPARRERTSGSASQTAAAAPKVPAPVRTTEPAPRRQIAKAPATSTVERRVASANTAPAPKAPAAKAQTRPSGKRMMAAATAPSAPRHWSSTAFSLPYRIGEPGAAENSSAPSARPDRAKPIPKRVPASSYRRATELEPDRIATRPRPSADRIEGTGITLNRILDRISNELDCSYILQPGIKTNLTVRLDVAGEPDEVLAQILKMAGLSYRVNGRIIYIGQPDWLEQVFPTVQASLVITEATAQNMDETVDVAEKISGGKLDVKRVGRYSVLTGSPDHLRLLLTSETLAADSSVQALYASHVPPEGLLKQVPSSILASSAMESFEDHSVRIQGAPTHVAAALDLLVRYDRVQSSDSAQLAMLRGTAKKN